MTQPAIALPLEGACLCGAVTLRIAPESRHLDACHCTMCRKWGGGPFLSFSAGTDPEIEGAEQVIRHPSSEWAERGFCGTCGTHLFYFYKPQGTYACPAGLFPDTAGFALTGEIFVDEQPDYYHFAEDTLRKTGAQAMAEAAKDS